MLLALARSRYDRAKLPSVVAWITITSKGSETCLGTAVSQASCLASAAPRLIIARSASASGVKKHVHIYIEKH